MNEDAYDVIDGGIAPWPSQDHDLHVTRPTEPGYELCLACFVWIDSHEGDET